MFGTLIRTFISPYLLYIKIGIILAGLATIFVVYQQWKANIQHQAIMEITIKNQEAIIAAKEKEIKDTQANLEELNRIREAKDIEIENLKKSLDNAMEMVQNNNVDRESSKLLKDTIEELRKSRR